METPDMTNWSSIENKPSPTSPEQVLIGKKRVITGRDDLLEIRFPYDTEIIADVRLLPGRRWSAENKYWWGNPTKEFCEQLLLFAEKWHFTVAGSAQELISQALGDYKSNVEASKASYSDLTVDKLGGELRPFQAAGVAYALKNKRTFIADEQGLGKTVQALATIQAAKAYPAVVVCPASLKLNWEREAKKWLPGRVVKIVNGQEYAHLHIVNYDVLGKHLDWLKSLNPQCIVLDESHLLKNREAQRSQAAKSLCEFVPYRLALTGTPVLNRPIELANQLAIIDRLGDFGGFWQFAESFTNYQHTKYGWDFSGARNLEKLNEKLRGTCLIRRLKADVLKELPIKQRVVIPLELDNFAEYREAAKDLISWLRDNSGEDAAAKASYAEQLVRIETLKKLTVKGKLGAVVEWVESFLESDEKLVLFAWHRETVNDLAEYFGAPSITGDTSLADRQRAVDKFQTDPECKLIVCNMQAGGLGITLTAASNVAFVELGWTPALHDQAEDRVHRIGQEESVTAWYLLAAGTIDEEIASLLDAKRAVVTATTEGGEATEIFVVNELVSKLLGGK